VSPLEQRAPRLDVGSDPRHVAIIGMMAVGKTTVGRMLADDLQREFVDLDQVLINKHAISIAEMFEEFGEAWFRAEEAAEIAAVLDRTEPIVFSLGGGAVTTPASRTLLHDRAFVVWLRASPTTLLARVGDASTRPLLAADPEGSIRRLDAARKDFYAQTAHYALSVDRRSARWVATAIKRRVSL
jgi:shikimate kinase